MSRGPVYVVPTESHVDEALRDDRVASTCGSFLARLTADWAERPATPEVTRLATALALESVRDEYLGTASHAMALALDEGLGALRRAGIDAVALRRADTPRAMHLARLLEATNEMFRTRHLFDDRALGWIAAAAIDKAPIEELPAAVVVDGLFHFDASQCAWLEALARRVPVTVRMPRTANEPALSILETRWQSLSRAPELEFYELAVPDAVTVVEARTEAAEARAIARAVLDALASGTAAEGIAIVVPALEEDFLEPLRTALGEARVAFREPRGRPPIASPAVRAALAWLDLASAPLNRDVLIDLLRTTAADPAPFVDGSTPSARRHRALAFAGRLARIPVRTDRDGTLLTDALAADISDEETWMLDSIHRVYRARGDLARAATRDEIVAKLKRTWDDLRLSAPSTQTMAALATQDPFDREASLIAVQLRDHATGFRALLEAADRVAGAARILGVADATVSTARFRVELEQALAGVATPGTRRPGSVRVVRAAEVVRLRTDLLIVARASEDALERASGGQAVLDDRTTARFIASRRPPSAMELAAANQSALLAAIDGAARLVVTRSATDAEGRPVAPARLFTELSERSAVLREPASPLHPAASVLSPRGRELATIASDGISKDIDVERRAAVERERLAFFLDPRRPANPWTGSIDTAEGAVREHLPDAFGGTSSRPIAATAIEKGAQCRFSAFATGVLRASSTDTIGEALEPWQRGSLVHRALWIAFEALRKRQVGLGRDAEVAAATAAARKVLVREQGSPLYRAEVDRALRDVAAVVEWSLEDNSDFHFAYGERSFGASRISGAGRGDPGWPALALREGDTTVYVRGRIDRIDLSRDGARARVIDYKTGSLPAWKDVGSLVFQPPLYAYVVLLQMGILSVPEVRSFYLDTSKRPPRTLPIEKSQVFSVEAIKSAERSAARVVIDMWNGNIAPRPADAAICSRCDVRDICRRPAAMPIDDLEPEGEGASS
jgi:ATP-dependent helicase/nuclease subunit B